MYLSIYIRQTKRRSITSKLTFFSLFISFYDLIFQISFGNRIAQCFHGPGKKTIVNFTEIQYFIDNIQSYLCSGEVLYPLNNPVIPQG